MYITYVVLLLMRAASRTSGHSRRAEPMPPLLELST